MKNNKTKADIRTNRVAMCGIMAALSLATVFAASYVPGIELTVYALSSLFISVAVIEGGPVGGILTYAVTLLLGFIIVPSKLGLLPFAMIFGLYPILKLYIEKIESRIIEILVKGIYFAVSLGIGFFFFLEAFTGQSDIFNMDVLNMPSWLIMIASIAMMFLYDFILSYLIGYYMKRVKGRNMKPHTEHDIKLDK